MVVTLGVTFLIAYYDRLNISLAMPLIAIEQGWSEAETASKGGLLMGLFYTGYGVANIFLSPLGTRIGPRVSLVVIILLWSLFTAMGAVLSQFMTIFMASRVLLGLAEGIHVPMMNKLTNTWFAPSERSRANSTWNSGLFLAILTAPILLVPIMERFGWRAGFYVLAVGGMLVSLPLVLRYVHNTPREHPNVGEKLAHEFEFDAGEVESYSGSAWHLFGKRSFQLLTAGGIVNNMVALGIAGWLPTYLSRLEGVRYADLTHLAAIPYAASLAGIALWAVVGDKTNRRTWVAGGGYLGAGALAALALAAGNANIVWLTVTLFSLAVFCVSAWTASEWALVQRLVPPEHVGNGVGIYNGFTTMIGGGLGPFVIGGIIGGRAEPRDLIGLFALCATISVLLALLSRRIDY